MKAVCLVLFYEKFKMFAVRKVKQDCMKLLCILFNVQRLVQNKLIWNLNFLQYNKNFNDFELKLIKFQSAQKCICPIS